MITHKPKRLFAFGDSFTKYFWTTWPQIIAYDLDIPMYNYGKLSAGNEYIFNTIIQAVNYYNIDKDDLVIVCWSGIDRYDFRLSSGWQSTVFDNINEDFLKELVNYPKGQAIKQFALIDSVYRILSNRCQFHMLSMNDLAYCDQYAHNKKDKVDLDELTTLYFNSISKIKPSFAEVLWNFDFNIKTKKDFNKFKIKPYADLHPSPFEHYEYLSNVFPNYQFNQTTIDKVTEMENIWNEHICENYSLLLDKKFNKYTDMIKPLTTLTEIVYNQDINII